MSELDRWEQKAKGATAALGAAIVAVGGCVVKAFFDYYSKQANQKEAQEKLRDVEARLESMGLIDKIFRKGDIKYLEHERDRLSK